MWSVLEDLIDELSFSGLNGCQGDEAWKICQRVCPSLSSQLDKQYFLQSLSKISDMEMYYCGKQCEEVAASNTFINEGNIRGFCLDFHTRVRCYEYKPDQAIRFVVRQDRREYAICKRWTNKIVTLNAAAYCLLEYIACGRKDGVMVVGTSSNKFVVNERPCLSKLLSMSAKAIFYQMEPLESLALVSKQDCLSKTHNRSKLIVHIKYEPNLNYFCNNPELERRHSGSLIDADILYHLFKMTEHYPQPSIEECGAELNVSRRMLRRLLEEPIKRGDLREIRHDVVGLTVPILEAMDKELRCRADKRSLGRRKRNVDLRKDQTNSTSNFPLNRPLIHSALYLIQEHGALAHSELSRKLRLDFYKARRLRNALSEMKDVEAQIDPEDAQEDHLYRIKNELRSELDISTESGQQRAARRKEVLLQLVKKRKATFAHRLKMDLCELEHKAGISTAVDRKTVIGLLQILADEGQLRLVKPNADENTLMVVSAEESKLPVERDSSISVRDADMIAGTIKTLREGEPLVTSSLQRCVTGMYGYVSKFQRCCVLHKFIFYLLYAHEDGASDAWKKNIPKPPIRNDQPSVIALGDVLLCMPLCIYANLVRIPIESQELMEYLSDERANMLIHALPESLKGQILQRRKFLFQIEATLKNLVMMGLAKFVENKSGSLEKQNLLVHVDNKAMFYDSSVNQSEPVKFEMNSMNDVESLWQFIMTSSLTDGRFCHTLRRGHRSDYDRCRALHLEPEYVKAMVPVKEVPLGYLTIPGNHDGPLGVDKRMFSWLSTNWSIYSMTENVVKELRKRYNGTLGPPIPYLCCRVTIRESIHEQCARIKVEKHEDIFSSGGLQSSDELSRCTDYEETDTESFCETFQNKEFNDPSVAETDGNSRDEDEKEEFLQSENEEEVVDLSTRPSNEISRKFRKRKMTQEVTIEFLRLLEVLRASLLFLSVRFERFIHPHKMNRMSTHHLIGWIVDELNLHHIDPRNERPDSNIRKLLNDEPIRQSASALCLQMSLDEKMQQFEMNCRLRTGMSARPVTNENVEVTLKEFYKNFKPQLLNYIVTGESLVSSKLDLRKIDLNDFDIVRRSSATQPKLIGDFYIPSRKVTNAVSQEVSQCEAVIAEQKKKIRAIILCLMMSNREERAQQVEMTYKMLKEYPEWLIEDILLTMHMDEHLIVKKKRNVSGNKSDKAPVGGIYELHSRFYRDFRPMPAATFSALNDRPESLNTLEDGPWVPAVLVSNLLHDMMGTQVEEKEEEEQ